MPLFVKLGALLVANNPQMPPCVKLAALLVANYPQMPPCAELAALLVANYPQMPLFFKVYILTRRKDFLRATVLLRQLFWYLQGDSPNP
jgi:hypothetical protein